jgi:hypothetical protein
VFISADGMIETGDAVVLLFIVFAGITLNYLFSCSYLSCFSNEHWVACISSHAILWADSHAANLRLIPSLAVDSYMHSTHTSYYSLFLYELCVADNIQEPKGIKGTEVLIKYRLAEAESRVSIYTRIGSHMDCKEKSIYEPRVL